MSIIDRSWVPVACPSCGIENDCRIQQMRFQEVIICRGCHATIHLHDEHVSMERADRKLDRAFEDLKKTLTQSFDISFEL